MTIIGGKFGFKGFKTFSDETHTFSPFESYLMVRKGFFDQDVLFLKKLAVLTNYLNGVFVII